MSALSIYALVCRNLFQFNSLDDPNCEVWEETVRKLRRLRHVVQCRVCKVIAKDPYGTSGCNHITCRDCKDSKKTNFSGCRYCKNPTALEYDKQTEVVLKCYAKVCEILHGHRTSGLNSHRKERIEKIRDLVSEGVKLFEKEEPKRSICESYSSSLAEKSQLSYSTDNSIVSQSRASDVDHVLNENKFTQDGGSFKDGRSFKDGASFKDGTHVQEGDSEKCKLIQGPARCSVLLAGINEKLLLESHTASPVNLDPGKDPGWKVNGHFLSQNQSRDGTASKFYTKKEKQSKNVSFSSNSLNDNTDSELHSIEQQDLKDGGVLSGEPLNGYSYKEQLNSIDPNGTTPQKHSKRKSNSEMAPLKQRKRKTFKDNDIPEPQNSQNCPTADDLNGQEASEPVGSKNNQFSKALRQCHRIESRLFTKQDEVCTRGEAQIASKKGRQSSRNRPYSFMRKNKYKCMCGSASGLKHFNDICNHKRCVCYAAGVPCVSCKCKFCSNPHKSHYSVKWSTLGIESDMRTVKIEQRHEHGM